MAYIDFYNSFVCYKVVCTKYDMKDVKKDPHNKKWNYDFVSGLKDLDLSFVKEYPDKDWCYFSLSKLIKNKKDFEFVKKCPDKDWYYFSLSKFIKNKEDFEFVKEYPDKNWDFKYFSNLNFINSNIINSIHSEKWNKNELLFNDNFDISWVNECQNIKWKFGLITLSRNFNIEWLYKYPRKKWDISSIEKKDCFFYDLISIFPHFKWSSKILNDYKQIQQHKEEHKLNYKDVLKEFLAVVYHPDNAERLGLFDNISKDDFEN